MLSQFLTTADGVRIRALRRAAERAILAALLLHGPALLASGLLAGGEFRLPLLIWAGIAAVAGLAHLCSPGTAATRITLSVGLCLMPALLIEELAGHPWQSDGHMYFFALLAVSALMLDAGAVLAGTVAIALHHLVLNYAMPYLVFPGGGDLGRVVFHAVIVIFEAAALCWLCQQATSAIGQAESSAAEIERLASAREAERAEAEAHAAAQRRAAALSMASELDRSLGSIAGALSESSQRLGGSADALSASAERMVAQAEAAATDTREASAGVGTVAAAAEEMIATVEEITRRVAETAAIAGSAVAEIRATDETVRQLSEGAERIGSVVALIAQIAGQTNLLALNATIEAARAGDAGKGFAVVASEVKTLASRTATATSEIGEQVALMQAVTARAVTAIQGIGGTVERTSEIATAIAAAVEQQGAATREVSRAAQEVAAGTGRVSASVADVSASAQGNGEAVDGVRASSRDVALQGEALRAEVNLLAERLRRQGEAA
ncbi:methyl-accepting chemotaxis protein [Muricoccus pecuniae]|uniref:Methyl-accepting chemotaxis protein n=1 Tax=Muricoccus pecuniae TaxID=693023 RepID=A0A840YCF1_9PROT|nr:methyl-accepting chemotaxis protein [Roseomonas pecuniae]MBB5693771.1 methyl-accepting chemotaxis protein [Roseomonas pecuniae]